MLASGMFHIWRTNKALSKCSFCEIIVMPDTESELRSPQDFGTYLRTARQQQRLTQAQAAGLARVGVRLWNEAENGKRAQVGLETALRMLAAVGVELRVTIRMTRHHTTSAS